MFIPDLKYQANEFGLYPEVSGELVKDFKQIIM